MLPITKQFINYNFSKRSRKIEYIIIHDVGAVSTAKNNRDYFAGGNRNSSADFFVDPNTIMQIIDYHKNYSWNCGDGKGKYGIANSNSVAIEMCLESNMQPSEKTVENTLALVKYLMRELNLSADRVVRHYDASRKLCPCSFSANNWTKWWEFKRRLQGYNSSSSTNIKVGSKVKVTGNRYATGQTIPSWVKKETYTVKQIRSNKALLEEIMSWVYTKDLVNTATSAPLKNNLMLRTVTHDMVSMGLNSKGEIFPVKEFHKGDNITVKRIVNRVGEISVHGQTAFVTMGYTKERK